MDFGLFLHSNPHFFHFHLISFLHSTHTFPLSPASSYFNQACITPLSSSSTSQVTLLSLPPSGIPTLSFYHPSFDKGTTGILKIMKVQEKNMEAQEASSGFDTMVLIRGGNMSLTCQKNVERSGH